DLIVGLPGDTMDSVRRGMHYLADNKLYDDIQVFQLSILPGTSFRHEAASLGLDYQPRPPYYVLRTPTLTLDQMMELLEESEEIFHPELDPLPPPALHSADTAGNGHRTCDACWPVRDGLPPVCSWDLDGPDHKATAVPTRLPQAFTMW